jgi:adenosine deaminase
MAQQPQPQQQLANKSTILTTSPPLVTSAPSKKKKVNVNVVERMPMHRHSLSSNNGNHGKQHYNHNQHHNHSHSHKRRSLSDCFEIFAEIHQVVNDVDALKRITREALEDFALEHVVYLELRSTPRILSCNRNVNRNVKHHHETGGGRGFSTTTSTSKEQYLHAILDEFIRFEAAGREQQQPQKASSSTSTGTINTTTMMIPRLLISIDRSKSPQEAEENVQLAIQLRHDPKYAVYVVGVDLGGNPTKVCTMYVRL